MWNILIADDETIERMIVKKVLTNYYKQQYTIYEAANGSEAIEAAKQHTFHAAVMDISMPGINGIEAAKEILHLQPDCMIIFLTAYEDFNYVREALSIHAIDYLLKPCSDEDLINAVDTAIQSHQKLSRYLQFIQSQDQPAAAGPSDYSRENKAEDSVNPNAMEILSYVRANFSRDLSLSELASRFDYSEAYFCRFFKNNFTVNFTTYLTNLRIDTARQLLRDTSESIKQIGSQVGYEDSNYFTKVFKRIVGVSPSEYRAEYQESADIHDRKEF